MTPNYFEIKNDLRFKKYLDIIKNKLKTQNNTIAKLTSTSWDSNALVLQTSTLILVYSVVEYCATVWSRSAFCKKVDVELNKAMQHISGTDRTI